MFNRLSIVAFLALAGVLISCSDKPKPPPESKPACPDTYQEAKDWTAIDNQQPPGRSFYVIGTVVVPTTGYTVELKKRSPQGINPAVLMLDLTVKKPSGASGSAITTHNPRYDEAEYTGTYTSVGVYCGETQIASPEIKVVH